MVKILRSFFVTPGHMNYLFYHRLEMLKFSPFLQSSKLFTELNFGWSTSNFCLFASVFNEQKQFFNKRNFLSGLIKGRGILLVIFASLSVCNKLMKLCTYYVTFFILCLKDISEIRFFMTNCDFRGFEKQKYGNLWTLTIQQQGNFVHNRKTIFHNLQKKIFAPLEQAVFAVDGTIFQCLSKNAFSMIANMDTANNHEHHFFAAELHTFQ